MEEYHTQCDAQNKVILLDLGNSAPKDAKTIIQHFDVDKNSDEIYKLMDSHNKPPIVKTAEFLQLNPTQVKDLLIRDIITKINSLLLEQCLKCKQYYAAKLEDEPIAICQCGQPCHTPCYSDLKEILNGSYPGVVFQCSRCFQKPTSNVNTKDKPSSNDTNEKGSSGTPKEKLSPDDIEIEKISSDFIDESTKPVYTLKVIESFNLDLLQSRYPQQNSFPICEDYKRGHCRHGRDGKTEVNNNLCKYLHPKKCFPWCKAGNKGCQEGDNCPFYHPRICNNSLRYRKCLNQQCTFAHLQGTKRYHRRNERNNRNATNNNSQPTHQSPWEDQTQSPQTAKTDNVNVRSFLEDLVQSLRKDIQTNQKEMQEFKQSITHQVHQIHQNLPQHQFRLQNHHQVHTEPTVSHHQIHQNQPQHHQIPTDQSATHNQIQHMQHLLVPQNLLPQNHMMMMKPLGQT